MKTEKKTDEKKLENGRFMLRKMYEKRDERKAPAWASRVAEVMLLAYMVD
jgi:hypothetical protein